jgi:5'-nucleotidase
MRPRIAIDMDETLADTLAHYLDLYNSEFGEHLTKADCFGRALSEVVRAEHRERILHLPRNKEFWHGIPPMPRSKGILAALLTRYEVFVTSAAMEYPASFGPKYVWIKEHFPYFPDSHIVFCGDKSVIATDYMIDDHARHFARYKGTALLFDAPHNRDEHRYPRLRDWAEIEARFLA